VTLAASHRTARGHSRLPAPPWGAAAGRGGGRERPQRARRRWGRPVSGRGSGVAPGSCGRPRGTL